MAENSLAALIVIACFVSGLIGAAIGGSRGRALPGFFLGAIFGILGWIVIAVMPATTRVEARRAQALADATNGSPADVLRVCPWCAEGIQPAAVVCRFCGRDVHPMPSEPAGGEEVTGPLSIERTRLNELRSSWRGQLPESLAPLRSDRVLAKLSALQANPSEPKLAAFVRELDWQALRIGTVPVEKVKAGALGAAMLAGIDEPSARNVIDKICVVNGNSAYQPHADY